MCLEVVGGCGEVGLELESGLIRVLRDLGVRESVERWLGREILGYKVEAFRGGYGNVKGWFGELKF